MPRLLCVLFLLLSAGCAAKERMSTPLPKAFLEDVDVSKKIERLPFAHSWSGTDVAWGSYRGTFVKPIRLDKLNAEEWKASASAFIASKEAYLKEVDGIAKYFHEQIRSTLQEKNTELSRVVDAPGPGVVTLEIALTEVEFSHPGVSSAALIAPIPASSIALSTIMDPHIAFAARLTDGGTGRLLATAADRKFAPRHIVNLNKLTVASANREICDALAEEFADTLSVDTLTKVNGRTWAWLPW